MHPSIAAALVAAVLTASWWLGRRRVPLVSDPDTSGVAALNRAQIALVQSGGASQPDVPSRPAAPASFRRLDPSVSAGSGSPARPLGRAAYRAQLEALFRGDGSDRLRAIEAARHWGDRLSLPLLRRGLRDSDPAVMRASALAIERFRGRSAAPQLAAMPRKVARTR